MSKWQKSTNLYATPFSRDYWRDAAAELRDPKMLVIAALLVALRVACKGLYIPIAPSLNINIAAPFINALGAMIFGPVVAALAAAASDTLGFLYFPQGSYYFFPCIFVEIGGSVVFAMFFYRAKITVRRVILARFTVDLFVNILLNSVVMSWYYAVLVGKSYAAMILPAVIKNLCLFPIEAFLLAIFLSVMIPVTYRMKLTYDSEADRNSMKFRARQFGMLLALFAVGVASVVGYLFYHYDHNSISASYSEEERYEANTAMTKVVVEQTDAWDDETLVTTIESAYRKFMKGYTTYRVAVYVVDEEALADSDQELEEIRGMSKSKAKAVAENGLMTLVGYAQVVLDDATGQTLSFQIEE